MKRIIPIITTIAIVICLCSCEKEQDKGPQVKTLSAEQGKYFEASLFGQVKGLENVALDYECGIEYSTAEDFRYYNRVKFSRIYTENEYHVTATDIRPGEKYYYRAYYINQLLVNYGDVKNFSFFWEAPEVETLSATLNFEEGLVQIKGLVKRLSSYRFKTYDRYYGIEYSTSETFDQPSIKRVYCSKAEGDTIYCNLSGIAFDSCYYYRVFFDAQGIKREGNIKSFLFHWECPEYIDLGLSVKWATSDIGANRPWDLGELFAWGEVEPKTEYSWANYKYCQGSENTLTKYCNENRYGYNDYKDRLKQLEPEDDVAHVKLGGNWRMPTKEECEELLNQCNWTSAKQNGIEGYKVYSTKQGYTNNYIFIPLRYRSYWSSSLHGQYPVYAPAAHTLEVGTFYNKLVMGNSSRYIGHLVRAVCP